MVCNKAGRLKYYVKEWSEITNDKYILSSITGYEIPFIQEPQQYSQPVPPTFSQSEANAVSEQIEKLLLMGAIEIVKPEPGQFISNVFVVPKQDKTFRLVFNLKNLNQFVEEFHFKLEDYRTVCNLIEQDCFMCVVDQENAYHVLPIIEAHRKYLRFIWNNIIYQYTCLPFGLSSAPYIFTKIMKPVISYLRERGHTSVTFLDDNLLIGKNYKKCENNVQATVKLFTKLGLLVNFEKSQLIPAKEAKYLGFIFNSKNLI